LFKTAVTLLNKAPTAVALVDFQGIVVVAASTALVIGNSTGAGLPVGALNGVAVETVSVVTPYAQDKV
jgi:outer membrane biogenesis lipoprotein LolB